MDYVRGGKVDFDEPKKVVEDSINEQRRLIAGFKGDERTNQEKFKEAWGPNQVAISLLGEPTMYPYLDELIKEYAKRKFTTFVVSNGTKPGVIKRINPTQLYVTLPAPNERIYKELCKPLVNNGWESIKQSLENLKEKKRSVVRMTMVKGWNMVEPEKYVDLIGNNADFIEVKAYMFVGFSRQRMSMENMPSHEDIVNFSKELEKYSDYKIIDEKKESRVVLLSRGKEPKITASQ
jgi:tRNA wybutosine-synthesizing protein 1